MIGIAVTVGAAPSRWRSRSRSRAWGWLEAAVGVAVIVGLLVRFGGAPILTAFRSLDLPTVVAAMAVAAGGTLCVAYRWRMVSVALGVPVGFARSVGAYYGSQFLNSTLPGGVLGDVHRGLQHGRDGHPLGRCLRAVAWERLLGQAVQMVLTLGVLIAVPSALRLPLPVSLAVVAVVALAGSVVAVRARTRRRRRRVHRGRALRTLAADWCRIAGARRALPRIAVASVGALAANVTMFLLSAHAVDPQLLVGQIVPVTLVVLLIGALPVSLAGWGPREGAAAWAFATSGWGGAQGLSVSVVFGVLALIGTLPGAIVLLAWRRGRPDG